MSSLYNSYKSLVKWLAAGKNPMDRPAPKSNSKNTRIVCAAPEKYDQSGHPIEPPTEFIPDWVGVKLHNTVVVKYYRDGSVQFNSDGWYTVTTRDRMNCYAPRANWNEELKKFEGLVVYIYTEKRIMYLVSSIGLTSWLRNDPNAKKYIYEDNMIIYPDGRVVNQDNDPIKPDDKRREKSARKELNQIKGYVSKFISKFIKQEIGDIDGGHCWYCLSHVPNSGIPPINTITPDGIKPEFDETHHIKSHIKESYFVPALLYNAIQSQLVGLAAVDNHNIAWCTKAPGWETHKPWSIDLTERRLKLLLTRYICKQMGYQVT
jgi:hypothetical protein